MTADRKPAKGISLPRHTASILSWTTQRMSKRDRMGSVRFTFCENDSVGSYTLVRGLAAAITEHRACCHGNGRRGG